ncbi:MAG: hypothetical protein MUO52_01675, partial [Desulfobacterales bacterium]|nr:hypothetical protein [Desulfobacterales bacterium]
RGKARTVFLTSSEGRRWVKGEEALSALDQLYGRYSSAYKRNPASVQVFKNQPLFHVVEAAFSMTQGEQEAGHGVGGYSEMAPVYLFYREEMARIANLQHQTNLMGTVAGRLGRMMEGITRLIGFDYRVNVALLGGFAAKEVIVSTLGTAYSLGEVDPEQSTALSERLRKDPAWSPLLAFTLIVFTMLYVPCFPTLISLRRESSWAWAGFSIVFNLMVAYGVSLLIYQTGLALRLGVP